MNWRWHRTVLLLGITAVLCTAGAAQAQNKCAAYKLKATAKKQRCLAREYAHAAQSSAPPQQSEIDTCEAKFSGTFAKVEGCLTTGDAAAIEAKVDAFVADLVTELDSGNPSRCQALKIKATANHAKCLLRVEAREAASGVPQDPLRAQKCQLKFDAAFANLEAGPECDTTGDAAAIDAKVDAFVADVDNELPFGP